MIAARDQLAEYGKTLGDAVAFYVNHLERVRRCKITVAELANEVVEAKRKDGRASRYIDDLRLKFKTFRSGFWQ